MNILLTANEAAGLYALRILKSSEHNISGIVTPKSNVAMYRLAKDDSFAMFQPDVLQDPGFTFWMRRNKVDVLLNVHLSELIHPEIIEAVNFGAFNLHPGPLPEYAGLNVPSWAIYNGENTHAVTLHWITGRIDTGPIAYKSVVRITPNDTGLTLANRCTMEGMDLITEFLDELSTDPESIPKVSQDLSRRRYFGKFEVPQNGLLKWDRTAEEIDRFVRACNYGPFNSPWGHPTVRFNGMEIEILSVGVTNCSCDKDPGKVRVNKKGEVLIASADKWVQVNSCRVKGSVVSPQKVFESNGIHK
ncbi:methionyl-tRNA formyltransferase [Gracilimonas tropica]|uniref:methionyl-tRNA formyltransferase n=1 Tax=Gracilimonas tropica TaxID=454600 RepID=UPI000362F68D|nr:formyltransferase family protein [Gracilimonas tropica]